MFLTLAEKNTLKPVYNCKCYPNYIFLTREKKNKLIISLVCHFELPFFGYFQTTDFFTQVTAIFESILLNQQESKARKKAYHAKTNRLFT